MNTITLCAKPHVASFVETIFKRYSKKHITDHYSPLLNAIANFRHCTTDHRERLIKSPPNMITFKVELPKPYQQIYIRQTSASSMASDLEDIFWAHLQEYIFKRLQYNIYKDHALKDFLQEYHVKESDYPIGHFRRQLHRMGMKGLKQKGPEIRDRIHIRIPDVMCWQIYRANKKRKISQRKLAKYYPYSRRQIERIITNINCRKMSKTVANTVA